MIRQRAQEVADKLLEAGYTVNLVATPGNDRYVIPGHPHDEPFYRVEVLALSLDKVDIKHLVTVADDLGLDAGYGPTQGHFTFVETNTAVTAAAIVHGPRRHPR